MPITGQCWETLVEVLAKILCIGVLIAQLSIIDSYFNYFEGDDAVSQGLWIFLDVFVCLWWAVSLLLPCCLQSCLQRLPRKVAVVLEEVRHAYLSWALYALVLCFKINHMYTYFDKGLPQRPELYSSTGLKLTLSMAGVVFLLLAYCHHKELQGVYYKLTMEKVAFSSCLDILDALMLLDFLFINESREVIATTILDKVVRAFACISVVLPTFPLLVTRCIQSPTLKHKWYRFALILQLALYLLLINFPLFSIRLHFWFTNNMDVSTFFTKNLIMIFKGVLEIIKESLKWYKDASSTSHYISDDPEVGTRLNTLPGKGKEEV